MSDWVRHALFWHLYPLGFVGAEPAAPGHAAVSHRLGHIVDWLDYAVTLGVSGLLLGPIFASSTHGYDTIDPSASTPGSGDDGDFDASIAAARRRGLRVILDGVFNHVGRDSRLSGGADWRAGGPGSPWFRLDWPSGQARGEEPAYATFEGHRRSSRSTTAKPPSPTTRRRHDSLARSWRRRLAGRRGLRRAATVSGPSSPAAVRQSTPDA